MIKRVFILFFFSFFFHGPQPMETHRLLHNVWYFLQNSIFRWRNPPPKGISPVSVVGVFFCQSDFARQWFIYRAARKIPKSTSLPHDLQSTAGGEGSGLKSRRRVAQWKQFMNIQKNGFGSAFVLPDVLLSRCLNASFLLALENLPVT